MTELRVRTAMIVAGGAGTRMAPLTATTPKPLLPFCGAPLLEGMVRRLADVGVDRVGLIVGADTAPFGRFAAGISRRLAVTVEVIDEPEPLDTAGGVRLAAERLDGPFFVLNGDILTDLDLGALVDHHHRAAATATIALTRVDDTSTFGVCVLDGDRVIDFVEKPPSGTLDGHDTVNAGTYVLEPSVFDGLPSGRLSFERQVFPAVVARGATVAGHVSPACWADLGTPARYRAGHQLALNGSLRWPCLDAIVATAVGLWIDEKAEVDASARLVPPVLIQAGAHIGARAQVGPHAVIGVDSTIAADVTVVDSVVHDRVHVGASVESVILADDVHLGRDVQIGRDVVFGERVIMITGVVADGARRSASDAMFDQSADSRVVEPRNQSGRHS